LILRAFAGGKDRSESQSGQAELALKAALEALDRNSGDLALELAESGISRFPAHAELHYVSGSIYQSRGDWHTAHEYFSRTIALQPDHSRAWNDKGCALHALGRIAEARAAFLQVVALDPRHAQALNNLGVLAAQAGALDEACRHFELACASDPSFFSAQFNLGRALKESGRNEEGDAALRRASELKPDGRAELSRALSVPAILDSADQARTIRFSIDEWLRGQHVVAIDNPAGEIEPTWFCLAYHGVDDTALYRRIAEFFALSCPALAFEAPHCQESRAPAERLKVGFISRYLHDHSVGRTTQGVIPRLSRERFEVYALFVAPVVDDSISRDIRDHADFAVVVPNSLQEARNVIAGLELDVLFYQDIGMDPLTYFLAFSRLAPAQCMGWGHPVTSGIPSIDAFISTEGFEPPDGALHYNERLLKMAEVATPSYYKRLDTKLAAYSKGDAGFEDSATAYFCPQTLFKMHPEFDAVLAAVLRADPRGIVYLLEYKSPGIVERLRARLHRGLPDVAERIRFLPRVQGVAHYYSRLKHADVLLDPLHYAGGNTSLEGFAFGKPIVTLPGAFMRGRHTLGMYRAMEMDDCIALSAEHYADLAVKLGTDLAFRNHVSERICARNAVLYEDERVVRQLEKALVKAAEFRRR
jgi:predicted O-linked N-acetylglucosamine transferase (SPINDLY family)